MLSIGSATEAVSCDGHGANGTHCCFIEGQVCEFLFPWANRCSLYSEWGNLADNPEWAAAPVGQFFARMYPGFDCGDWPQRIPNVTGGLCCWEGVLT